MTFAAEDMEAAHKLAADAKEKATALKAQAEEATRAQRMWDEMELFLRRGWPLHVSQLIDRCASLLKQLRAENHPAIPTIESIYRQSREQSDAVIRRFPALLQDACMAAALPLDQDSRHPRYGFEGHFFSLEIDDHKRQARLSTTEGRLADLPADIEAIVDLVKREHKRIFERSFSGAKFLKALHAQYVAITKEADQPDGSSVPIRHITQRLSKNLKGFRMDEFIADLSRLTEQGPFDIDGCRLDLQQTKDTDQGVLLQGKAGSGYVGFLVFRKA